MRKWICKTRHHHPLFQGSFVSSAHPNSGKASVNTEKTILSLTNFKTDSEPSLEIYLATNTSVSDYISLGAIKGVVFDTTSRIF